jgi:hypothetical protein
LTRDNGGAYAYGKTASVPYYEGPLPRRGIRRKPRQEWLALIPDAHEGYVEWPLWEAIRNWNRAGWRRQARGSASRRSDPLPTLRSKDDAPL